MKTENADGHAFLSPLQSTFPPSPPFCSQRRISLDERLFRWSAADGSHPLDLLPLSCRLLSLLDPPNLLKATKHKIIPLKLIPDPIPPLIPLKHQPIIQHLGPRPPSVLSFVSLLLMRDKERDGETTRLEDGDNFTHKRFEVWEWVIVGCFGR
jgi:hypothetical protein